jgi:hypothetical protein
MVVMKAVEGGSEQSRVLIEYMSPGGPTITHVRGIMLVNAMSNLRSVGLYEEYVQNMPRQHLELLQQSLATDWIPVATTSLHYETCDRIGLTQVHFEEFGVRQAQRITETFLGVALRRARAMGVHSLKQTLLQVDRLHDRLYQGGGCAVIEVGPKDVLFELHGFPFAGTRSFKTAWQAYVRAIGEGFAKVAYVKPARPRQPHPHRQALLISWV